MGEVLIGIAIMGILVGYGIRALHQKGDEYDDYEARLADWEAGVAAKFKNFRIKK